jgi:hypothetical protein
MRTLIDERVRTANEGTNPTVICRTRSGWAVLGDSQFFLGYSLLLPDPVVYALNSLSGTLRGQFQAIGQFLDWYQRAGFSNFEDIEPIHVAAYIEQHSGSVATIKQHRQSAQLDFRPSHHRYRWM